MIFEIGTSRFPFIPPWAGGPGPRLPAGYLGVQPQGGEAGGPAQAGGRAHLHQLQPHHARDELLRQVSRLVSKSGTIC